MDMKVNWAVTRQCMVCEKEIHGDQLLCCERCQAVIYCGSVCQKQHWKETHKSVCGLYKAMMEREEELAMKVFVFTCFFEHPCIWLESVGLHQQGMWRRKCNCYAYSSFGMLPVKGGLLDAWGGLGDGEYPPDSPIPNFGGSSSPILLSGWSSIITFDPSLYQALLLLYSPTLLTLYYILTALSISSKNLLLKGREVVLHYIGPECELDWIPAFTEIGHLLNGSGNIQMIMVGPEVPSHLSGTVSGISSRVRVNFVRFLPM
ncbi:uncharacterized protein [Aristolochia californica]|uniref:uncharacterized protein n=1 Tax=Aristolochia californica TaxID=171875 RepID=UPI0035D7A830